LEAAQNLWEPACRRLGCAAAPTDHRPGHRWTTDL